MSDNQSFMTKSLQDDLNETSILSDTKLKNKYSKIKDENNPGARLINKTLKKFYKKEKYVLNGFSFTLYENEIFALLGQNGQEKVLLFLY